MSQFEKSVNALGSQSYRDAVQASLVPVLLSESERIQEIAPFGVSASEASLLHELGIPSNPGDPRVRPHKLHYAICRAINLVAASTFRGPTTIVSCKDNMYSFFQKHSRRGGDGLSLVKWLCNLRLDGPDAFRYPDGGQRLPRMDPECTHVHFDHSGHFLSQADLEAFFFLNPGVKSVTFSACLPPEALNRWMSIHPALYDLRYSSNGSSFHYSLEPEAGRRTDTYEQPLSSLSWLFTRSITGRVSLRVDFLQQWCAFHLVSVQRVGPDLHKVLDSERIFGAGHNYLIPEIYFSQVSVRQPLVPARVYHSVVGYLQAVSKAEETDVWGKLRTSIEAINSGSLTLETAHVLAQVTLTLARHSVRGNFRLAYFRDPWSWLVAHTWDRFVWFCYELWAPLAAERYLRLAYPEIFVFKFKAVDVVLDKLDRPSFVFADSALSDSAHQYDSVFLSDLVSGAPTLPRSTLSLESISSDSPFSLCTRLGAKLPWLVKFASSPIVRLSGGLGFLLPLFWFLFRSLIINLWYDFMRSCSFLLSFGFVVIVSYGCVISYAPAPLLEEQVLYCTNSVAPLHYRLSNCQVFSRPKLKPHSDDAVDGHPLPSSKVSTHPFLLDGLLGVKQLFNAGPPPLNAPPFPNTLSPEITAPSFDKLVPEDSVSVAASVAPSVASSCCSELPRVGDRLHLGYRPVFSASGRVRVRALFRRPRRSSRVSPNVQLPEFKPSSGDWCDDESSIADTEVPEGPGPAPSMVTHLTDSSVLDSRAGSAQQSFALSPSSALFESMLPVLPYKSSDLYDHELWVYRNTASPLLAPPEDCFLQALVASGFFSGSVDDLWSLLHSVLPPARVRSLRDGDLFGELEFASLAALLSCKVRVEWPQLNKVTLYGLTSGTLVPIRVMDQHATYDTDYRGAGVWVKSGTSRVGVPVFRDPSSGERLSCLSLKQRILSRLRASGYSFRSWHPSQKRAQVYMQDVAEGVCGTIRGSDYAKKAGFDPMVAYKQLKVSSSRPVHLMIVAGAAGSSKSQTIRAAISQCIAPSVFSIGTPRKALRLDWSERSPELDRYAAINQTYEKLLTNPSGSLLFLDEYTLIPPGYLEAFLLLHPQFTHVVLIGDPCQASFHEPNRGEKGVNSLASNARYFSPYVDSYLNYSFSAPAAVCYAFNLGMGASASQQLMRVYTASAPSFRYPLLCPTEQDVLRYNSCGMPVHTYTSAQGCRFEFPRYDAVEVIVNAVTARSVPASSLYTALTRAKTNLVLVLMFNNDQERSQAIAGNPILRALLTPSAYRSNSLSDLFSHSLGNAKMLDQPPIRQAGKRVAALGADKFSSLPVGLRVRFLHPEQEVSLESSVYEAAVADHRPMTYISKASEPQLREQYLPVPWKDTRELVVNGESSSQFNDAHQRSHLGNHVPPAIRQYQQMYPKQNRTDHVTTAAGIAKRVKRSTPELNARQFARSDALGLAMFEAFLRAMELPQDWSVPWCPQRWLRAVAKSETKKLSKSAAQLIANWRRSEPEWTPEAFDLATKAQLKVKTEQLNQPAKAAQTLATFGDAALMELGPLSHYLMELILELKPDHVYIHSGVGPSELDSVCKARLSPGTVYTTNDFENFDVKQDGIALNSEVELMRRVNTPSYLVNLYVFIKLNAHTWLGSVAIMRFTGEFCTYLFNTVYNIAYCHLRFDIPRGTLQFYSGDDSAFAAVLRDLFSWQFLQSFFSIGCKLDYTTRPEFCSWYLTPVGIYKNPRTLYHRCIISHEAGTLCDTALGYAFELSFAINLADQLHSLLTDEDLEYHYGCLRFMQKEARFSGVQRLLGLHSSLRVDPYAGIVSHRRTFRRLNTELDRDLMIYQLLATDAYRGSSERVLRDLLFQ